MSEDNKSKNQAPVKKLPTGGWKSIFRKKWVFPAMYMGAAAIILAFIMWYQNNNDFSFTKDQYNVTQNKADQKNPASDAVGQSEQKSIPVNSGEKPLSWPVKPEVATETIMGYFDDTADKKAQQAALIQYENSYWPNSGIAIAAKDKKAFEVVASAPGKVVKAEKDPMMGYQVEIQHENGLVTVYSSLEDASVKQGENVEAGSLIGLAGRSVLEKNLGVHLHFEVRKNGEPVSPENFLAKAGEAPAAK
ncbi:MAG TPA: M23 family peptidase [Paenibacillaceae bacterium]|nr:M23 family peptidase [Paenibacillaceae bacterium]